MTDPTGSPENTSPVPPAYPAAPPAYPTAPAASSEVPPAYPTAPPAAGPVPGQPAPGAPVPGKTLGIVALILAFVAQLFGLILGIVALVQSRKAGVRNLPALWAIIVSSVLMVIGIIVGIIVIVSFVSLIDQATQYCLENPGGSYQINGVTQSCPAG
ncbi:DUF4190 domain-containing protein [Microbacterium sp. Clip185]|uniref:DUF4190 domain-containing protein n=1 Tax=Microbacterium sp. Clip185 TaxID=3025663 RepID=UPI002365DF2E|nr:DUF4190 domain-containing protein [Microbacterium sp. Clip185]WDG19128.1 DUF4190 domain-containing protein [Microbacterium sp. Clip185]